MKFSIKKADIIEVLSKVQGVTGRRSSLAITETILMRAKNDAITITATDLETGFEGVYPAIVEKEGTIALNSRKFYEIIRDFPTDDIIINEVENRWIEIGHPKVLYHIVGMNPDDFPDAPAVNDTNFMEIDSYTLKRMIERSIIVTGASDDKRAHIIGVYLQKINEKDKSSVRMVSTDGSRLMMMDGTYEGDIELKDGDGILIPKKGLNEINKFLDTEGLVNIGIKDNHFVLKKEKEIIIVRLLEGAFPNYEQIVEKENGHVILMNKKQFAMMLKRMSILFSDDYKAAIFNFEKDSIIISASNPDIGESKEDMPIEYDGESMTIAFNPKYFIDTLNVIDSEEVIIFLVNEEKPCLIFDKDDDSFISAIMPMRI
jgi:DNA polymerase III subunit beta